MICMYTSRASKLLKSEAATALRHLTLIAFSRVEIALSRLNEIPPSDVSVNEPGILSLTIHWDMCRGKYKISDSEGITLLLGKITSALSTIIDPSVESTENIQFFLSLLNVALEAGGPSLGSMEVVVDILRGDICRHLLHFSQSEDLAVFSLSLRVVFNLFMSIKNHMKVQLEVFFTSVHLNILKSSSTTLFSGLHVAREELVLESLLEFCREPSLMHDIYSNYDCDVRCTNLFDSIITTLCSRAIPSGSYSMFSNSINGLSLSSGRRNDMDDVKDIATPFVNILNRLSLEGVLSILHAVAVRCSQLKHCPPLSKQGTLGNDISVGTQGMETMTCMFNATDICDVDAWCMRSEDDEYDVGFEASPSEKEFPSHQVVNSVPMPNSFHAESTAATLRQRKLQKQRILSAAEKFNSNPLSSEWVKYASEMHLLPRIRPDAVSTSGGAGEGLCDARSIAFFLKDTPGLGKKQVGEYISKGPAEKYPFHAAVLAEYCGTFVFAPETTFVEGFRQFLGHFHLPGEAQCIDRIMEAFASRIYDHLGQGRPFVNADAAFVLSFSTIMLNTDLHNTGIAAKQKMSKEDFIRNNRGINDGQDLPVEFLEELYDEIKRKQIMVDASMIDGDATVAKFADTAAWEKLLIQSQSNQAPAAFTPTLAARRCVSGELNIAKKNIANGEGICQYYSVDINGYITDDSTSKESDCRDDGDNSKCFQYIFPPSAHEKDMFQVMTSRVIDVVLEVMDATKDDILMCKAMVGLWHYATICVSLKMSRHLDELIQLMAAFSLDWLQNSRNILSVAEYSRDIFVDEKDCPLKCALHIDFTDFFSTGGYKKYLKSHKKEVCDDVRAKKESCEVSGSKTMRRECQNGLEGNLHVFKGYILFRLLLFFSKEFKAHIGRGGWLCITKALLWTVSQGALPQSLTEFTTFKNSRGGELDPSPFAERFQVERSKLLKCEKLKLETILQKENKQGSVWESVATLGGLLWSNDTSKSRNLSSNRNVAHEKLESDMSHQLRPDHFQLLLRLCMEGMNIESLFLSPPEDLPARVATDMIWCMMSTVFAFRTHIQQYFMEADQFEANPMSDFHDAEDVKECFSKLYAGRHKQRVHDFFGFLSEETKCSTPTENTACGEFIAAKDVVENNAVVVLEWVSRLLFAHRRRYRTLWPHFMPFMQHILVKDNEEFCKYCPYLVERAFTIILSLSIHSSNGSGAKKNASKGTTCAEVRQQSFQLLTDIPHHIIFFSANHLGAGLFTIIRESISKSFYETGVEEWKLLFSLLTSATVGTLGRPYVWETICYLVDNDHISSKNFIPCRNLIFRFLYRVFPSDDEDYDNECKWKSNQQPESKDHNPWLTGALLYQMQLTLMSLGGYCLATARAMLSHDKGLLKAEQAYREKCAGKIDVGADDENSEDEDQPEKQHKKYMRFPLPVDEMTLSHNASLLNSINIDKRSEYDSSIGKNYLSDFFSKSPLDSPLPTNYQTSSSLGGTTPSQSLVKNAIKVLCVEFSKMDDVEDFWLESVKTFSDFANTQPLAVSRNSTFCLKTIIHGAQVAEMPRKCWLEALTEMLTRLPLHAEKTIAHFELQQLKQLQREQEDLAKKDQSLETPSATFSLFSLTKAVSRIPAINSLPSSKLAVLASEGYGICLNCSVIVFDTLVHHFKKLKNYEEFQPFWIKYVSILAHNAMYCPSGSLIHVESVDMIGSLFRLLYQPDNFNKYYNQLLHLTWTAVSAICPPIAEFLEVNHPNIVAVLLRNQADFQEDCKHESSSRHLPSTNSSTPSYENINDVHGVNEEFSPMKPINSDSNLDPAMTSSFLRNGTSSVPCNYTDCDDEKEEAEENRGEGTNKVMPYSVQSDQEKGVGLVLQRTEHSRTIASRVKSRNQIV